MRKTALVTAAAFAIGMALGHHLGERKTAVASMPASMPVSAPVQSPPIEGPTIEGMVALQQGDYEKAASLLTDPVLRAIALEGAGRGDEITLGDADIDRVRIIGRSAFIEHQDIAIAGPAYQLYLRLRPETDNREMMENAVRLWKEK